MRDLAQAAEQLFQQLGRQRQRVAAGEQHIPHLGGAACRYSICASNSAREKVALGSPTMRERVQ